ncbi:hypothetical protein T190115A13A_70159 [Tenacibaculum sp. 190524A02b]|uniref:Uncharacterized protein n=1 Tax=Tenacibaculum vairaonense TaxID=3137860 RepID=A0ABP1FGC2_9FLAO
MFVVFLRSIIKYLPHVKNTETIVPINEIKDEKYIRKKEPIK